MNKFKLLKFPQFFDKKGSLVPFEFMDIPFAVKRVYLVTGEKGVIRGKHAHLIEDELFVTVAGSVKIKVNDGRIEKEIFLDKPNQGLLVKKHCWHELYDFAENTVVMAFSSTPYLPGDQNYLTNKEKFLQKFGE